MGETIKAFSYLRVSGLSQVEGDGLQRQRERISAYALHFGYEVVQEFTDEGVSGVKDHLDRPGLSSLMLAIASNGVRTVLIERADRLARNLMVSEIALEEFRKIEARVISVDIGQDLTVGDDDDPTKKLFRQFLGAIAEWEKTVVVKKLAAARKKKRDAGERCDGAKPYGDKDGEKEIVVRIVELSRGGLSLVGIAKQLNDDGVKPRRGAKWHPTGVCRILRRNNGNERPVQNGTSSSSTGWDTAEAGCEAGADC